MLFRLELKVYAESKVKPDDPSAKVPSSPMISGSFIKSLIELDGAK